MSFSTARDADLAKVLPLPCPCGRMESGDVCSMLHFGLFARRRGEGLGVVVVRVLSKARQRKVHVGQSLRCTAKRSMSWETYL